MRRIIVTLLLMLGILLGCNPQPEKQPAENPVINDQKPADPSNRKDDAQAPKADAQAQEEKEALEKRAQQKALADAIKARLEAAVVVSAKRKVDKSVAIDLRYDGTLMPFYEGRQFASMLWKGDAWRPEIALLEAEIDAVERHALPVTFYRLERLHAAKEAAKSGKAADLAAYELLLVDTWLKFARDLSLANMNSLDDEAKKGLSKPPTTRQRIDVILARLTAHLGELARALEDGGEARIKGLIDSIYPPHNQYRRLLEARQRYIGYAEQYPNGFTKLKKRRLKKGRSNPMIVKLKKRLAEEDFYHGEVNDMYDDALDAALIAYAETHQYSLRKGVPLSMWKSMNVPIQSRIKTIEENIRRWHQTMVVPSDYYLFINIPDFHGELWKNNQLAHRFRVVVGNRKKECHPETHRYHFVNATARLREKMMYLEYNPYWNVPRRIEQEEYLPKMHEDPTWLETHGYEYYTEGDYTVLRQLPGEANALGRVKFIFPNEHSIFLHDSPQKRLFERPTRAFSHGCMRVQDPLLLAEILLKDDGQWEDSIRKEINRVNARGHLTPKRILFKRRFDVISDYYTVRVDDAGLVHFLADPYRYVQYALNPPSSRALKCTPKEKEILARPNADGTFDVPAGDGEDVTVEVDGEEGGGDSAAEIDAAQKALDGLGNPSATAKPMPTGGAKVITGKPKPGKSATAKPMPSDAQKIDIEE